MRKLLFKLMLSLFEREIGELSYSEYGKGLQHGYEKAYQTAQSTSSMDTNWEDW